MALLQIDKLIATFDRKLHPKNTNSPWFQIQRIAGKGQGWIATASIPKGTIIYQQPPDISIATSNLNATTLQSELNKLSDCHRSAFDALLSHRKFDNKLLDIFSCNAIIYQLPTQKDISFAGLFLTFAKLNHDCNPNARWFFDEFTFDDHANHIPLQLITLKDISIGEEITVSYFDIVDKALPTRIRKYELFDRWGFHCTCKWCKIDGVTEKQMDDALQKFGKFMDKCDYIILLQSAQQTNNQDLWRLVYQFTNECLIMLTVLFNDDISMLWKLYKRRLPAVLKLNDEDAVQHKRKCIETFNELYRVSRLDFDVEFVATYYALDVLRYFEYGEKYMAKFPDAIRSNKQFVRRLFECGNDTTCRKHDDCDSDDDVNKQDYAGNLFESDDDL